MCICKSELLAQEECREPNLALIELSKEALHHAGDSCLLEEGRQEVYARSSSGLDKKRKIE